MDPQTFLDLIFESIQESARQARLSSGRPSSQATLKEALQQVAIIDYRYDSQKPAQIRTLFFLTGVGVLV